jgi:hypothetical protein
MMTTFGWATRLKYGALAAAAGWLAGWLIGFPFELFLAWRYVDGHTRQLPGSVAEGMLVWAAFSLFMAVAGFLPLVLPLILLIPPAWIVRWRWLVVPAAPLAAMVAINYRMGFLNVYYLHHRSAITGFFFSAPNFFVVTFALVVVWVYVVLAKRRLSLGER